MVFDTLFCNVYCGPWEQKGAHLKPVRRNLKSAYGRPEIISAYIRGYSQKEQTRQMAPVLYTSGEGRGGERMDRAGVKKGKERWMVKMSLCVFVYPSLSLCCLQTLSLTSSVLFYVMTPDKFISDWDKNGISEWFPLSHPHALHTLHTPTHFTHFTHSHM